MYNVELFRPVYPFSNLGRVHERRRWDSSKITTMSKLYVVPHLRNKRMLSHLLNGEQEDKIKHVVFSTEVDIPRL